MTIHGKDFAYMIIIPKTDILNTMEVTQIQKKIQYLENQYQQLRMFNADDEESKKQLTLKREEVLEQIVGLQEKLLDILQEKTNL